VKLKIMSVKTVVTLLGVLASGCAPALAVELRLEFEVASVKPAAPPTDGRIRIAMAGGPGSPDPGRINFEFVNLRQVLTRAYGVKSYQISGPDWLDSERFNITAKVPAGTTKEQFLVMLQNLVIDRFQMTMHREKKDLPAFALVVAKGGVKMKVAAEETAPPEAASGPPPNGRPVIGKDGFPEFPKGAGQGRVAMMMMPGRMRMVGNGQPVSRLAETLEQQLDRAVVDQTELTGKYDFSLTFEPEQNRMMGSLPLGMGRGPGGEGGPPNAPDAEPAPNIFTAVQEQLGLKLEPRKIMADLIVIDHLEKAPIEN
jgi:uncharacterized protein (TIGR03435 family)